MKKKSLRFTLSKHNLIEKGGGRSHYYIAKASDRKITSYEDFCKRVAKSTTTSAYEVEAMLSSLFDTIRDVLREGDSVELDGLGVMSLTFSSKTTESEEAFIPQEHISNVRAQLRIPRKHKMLDNVLYERIPAHALKLNNPSKSGSQSGSEDGTSQPGI